MRTRGTGTIEQRADGFYPRLPGRRGRWLPPCSSWDDAERALTAALELLSTSPAQGGLTVASYGERVIDRREIEGQRCARTDRNRWHSQIERSSIGAIPLAYLQRADVVAWCDELATRKAQAGRCHGGKVRDRVISKQTAQNALTLLRVVLADAVDRGLIEENAAATVRLPHSIRKRAQTHETWTYLLLEEQAALLGAECIPERERLAIQFAMGTCCRESSQWAVELRDLNMKAKTVTFRVTKNGKPKTIPLLPLALEAVDRWLPMLAEQPNPHRLLWPSVRGHKRAGDPKLWQTWLETLNLTPEARHDGRHVRWHDLRHTGATSLLCGWWGRRWSLEEVQALLDHESKTTTERYAHIAKSVLDDAARESEDVAMRVTTMLGDLAQKRPAPPARVERTTNGLGILRAGERFQELEPSSGDSVVTRAREAIRRAGEELLRGGRFTVARTIDLMELSAELCEDVERRRASESAAS